MGNNIKDRLHQNLTLFACRAINPPHDIGLRPPPVLESKLRLPGRSRVGALSLPVLLHGHPAPPHVLQRDCALTVLLPTCSISPRVKKLLSRQTDTKSMWWRSIALASILMSVVAVRDLMECLAHRSPPLSAPSLPSQLPHYNAESHFARGLPFPLSCATVTDLELLRGITDRLAHNMIQNRAQVASTAKIHGATSALTAIRGIGHATAQNLQQYLSVDAACPRDIHPIHPRQFSGAQAGLAP